MIKPTHHFRGSKPLKHCTHTKIEFTISDEHFENIINELLQEIDDNLYIMKSNPKLLGTDRLIDENQITRTRVEKVLRRKFQYKGLEGFERDLESDVIYNQIQLRKDKINILKEKLFPDWFGSNSLKFINEK